MTQKLLTRQFHYSWHFHRHANDIPNKLNFLSWCPVLDVFLFFLANLKHTYPNLEAQKCIRNVQKYPYVYSLNQNICCIMTFYFISYVHVDYSSVIILKSWQCTNFDDINVSKSKYTMTFTITFTIISKL